MARRKTMSMKSEEIMYEASKKPFTFYSNGNEQCMAIEKSLVELGHRFVKVEAKNSPSLVAGSKVYFGENEVARFLVAFAAFRSD